MILLYATAIDRCLFLESVSKIKKNVLFLLQIKTPAQLEAAFTFVTVTGSEKLDINKFEEACGVGILYFFYFKYFF